MPQTPTDDVVAEFLADSRWGFHTVETAVSNLNAWCRWLEPRVALLRADARHLEGYLDELDAAGRAQSTRRKAWQQITAFYAWAARPVRPARRGDRRGGGLLRHDPMASVRPPYVSSKPRTKAAKAPEVDAIVDSFGPDELGRRNAAMVSLMWRSGLRGGELPMIDLADVVEWGTTGRQVIRLGTDTKTGEPRLVPVHPDTQRYLTRYLTKRGRLPGPLFLGRAGHTADRDGRLSSKAIADVVERAARRVGVKVSMHQFRRGFVAQYLRASKGDVLSLEVIAGFADHRMPRRYLADEEAQAGVERFFDVFDGTIEGDELAPRRRAARRR